MPRLTVLLLFFSYYSEDNDIVLDFYVIFILMNLWLVNWLTLVFYTPQPQANSEEDLTQETGSQKGNETHMAPGDRAEVRRMREDEGRGCSDSHVDGWLNG